MRLHLAKDILMIQEQDVICVSGEPFYSGVSSFYFLFKMFFTKKKCCVGAYKQMYAFTPMDWHVILYW